MASPQVWLLPYCSTFFPHCNCGQQHHKSLSSLYSRGGCHSPRTATRESHILVNNHRRMTSHNFCVPNANGQPPQDYIPNFQAPKASPSLLPNVSALSGVSSVSQLLYQSFGCTLQADKLCGCQLADRRNSPVSVTETSKVSWIEGAYMCEARSWSDNPLCAVNGGLWTRQHGHGGHLHILLLLHHFSRVRLRATP